MLNENLQKLRRAKGLSQQELAIALNVVRQTVSKWEKGLSVPDADMLIKLAEALDTTVSTLLGEAPPLPPAEDARALAAKLEVLNAQLAQYREKRRRMQRIWFALLGAAGLLVLALQVWDWLHMGEILALASFPQDIGVIGGADGPTAIIVTRAATGVNWPAALLGIACATVAAVGICKTRSK